MLPTLMLVTTLAPAVAQAPAAAATACGNEVAALAEHLKSPQNHGLRTEIAVVLDGNAYAEHSSTCGESCTATGEASLAPPSIHRGSGAIAGASSVAVPGFAAHPLTFLLSTKHGKARMRWTVLGKTFDAEITQCTGGLWTAAQGSKSAIIVHITKNPAPPQ